MEVDAVIWYHWREHMRNLPRHANSGGYIAVRDVERLLEEAHARGVRQGRRQENERGST